MIHGLTPTVNISALLALNTQCNWTEYLLYQVNASEKASLIFSDLDQDGNGTVDEDEFIKYKSTIELETKFEVSH